MSVSDIIQIVSIVCTSILSIAAIIISILTLLQNNKMIFESNKPSISIFSKVINFTSTNTYLVLKNYGISGATILNIECDTKINSYFSKIPFSNLKNVYIAPNQSFLYPLPNADKENLDKTFNFKVTYKYLNKIYSENCVVSFNIYKDIAYLKTHISDNKEFKELSEILQEMTLQSI